MHPLYFSVFGFAHTAFTMAFAVLGFLSPANRGGLLSAILLFYVFMGVIAGYQGARFYKLFAGAAWKSNTILTATFVPGVVFGIFFILNAFFWAIWFFTGGITRVFNGQWGLPWPVWPALGWGIGLAFHYMDAYVTPKSNSVETEYEKLKNQQQK